MNKIEAVNEIKKNLWSHGYKVKDATEVSFGKYDLVVEGKFRVFVFADDVNVRSIPDLNEFDVMAYIDEELGGKKVYALTKDLKNTKTKADIVEATSKKNQEVFGPKSP